MQSSFDWNDLKFFLELHRSKRLIVAAKSLKVNHTTVARRIRGLEQSIGAQLFSKDDSGYQLTAAGESLLSIAAEIERATQQACENIGGEAGRLSGRVRVGAPDGIGTVFIAPMLARFQENHVDLQVELTVMPRYFNLSQQEVHLSLSLALPQSGRLLARKMTDYHLLFYAAPSYLERYGAPKGLNDLRRHRIIGYIDEMLYAPELRYTKDIGSDLPVVFSSTSVIAQREAILSGTGIGILPRFLAHGNPKLLPILSDHCLLTRTIWLLSHQSTEALARVRVVSQFLQQEARNARDLFLVPQS
tara:strand:+ start:18752 stop:19660 length:909 start_codon:yes stop_codon:yes gene_type:complete